MHTQVDIVGVRQSLQRLDRKVRIPVIDLVKVLDHMPTAISHASGFGASASTRFTRLADRVGQDTRQ
jgi:hypothetical protein